MKIADVEAFYLRLPEIQERSASCQDTLLVRITTDDGIVGWGEVDSPVDVWDVHSHSEGLCGHENVDIPMHEALIDFLARVGIQSCVEEVDRRFFSRIRRSSGQLVGEDLCVISTGDEDDERTVLPSLLTVITRLID